MEDQWSRLTINHKSGTKVHKPSKTYKPNGKKECARRVRQRIARDEKREPLGHRFDEEQYLDTTS